MSRNRGLDLREVDVDLPALLTAAGEQLGTRLDPNTVRFGGEDGATCGARSDRDTWVRLQQRPTDTAPPTRWDAEESAAALTGVRKPSWHRAATWTDPAGGLQWRADELDLITDTVVGGLIDPPANVPDNGWWHDLRDSLQALAQHTTARTVVTQTELTRQITTLAGEQIDTRVPAWDWGAAHGDLCWPNLTTSAVILDWETWGEAPRGYDAASLWGVCLPYPELTGQLTAVFAEQLHCRAGQLCRLAWCATALPAVQQRDELARYRDPIKHASDALLEELR